MRDVTRVPSPQPSALHAVVRQGSSTALYIEEQRTLMPDFFTLLANLFGVLVPTKDAEEQSRQSTMSLRKKASALFCGQRSDHIDDSLCFLYAMTMTSTISYVSGSTMQTLSPTRK